MLFSRSFLLVTAPFPPSSHSFFLSLRDSVIQKCVSGSLRCSINAPSSSSPSSSCTLARPLALSMRSERATHHAQMLRGWLRLVEPPCAAADAPRPPRFRCGSHVPSLCLSSLRSPRVKTYLRVRARTCVKKGERERKCVFVYVCQPCSGARFNVWLRSM